MQRKVGKTAIPPPSVSTLNAEAREQLENLASREAIARLACSAQGITLLRESQDALPAERARKLNELLGALEAARSALKSGGAWTARDDGMLLLKATFKGEIYSAVSWWQISEILSLVVARADGLSALALLHARLPRPGQVNINPDRILPARLAMGADRPASRAAVHPGGSCGESRRRAIETPRLRPGADPDHPVAALALYDLGGASSMERGRGAPLALRLWVESILAVGLTDRDHPWPTVLEIPLRDLLRKLYPGKRRPKPNEYWPRLMQAVESLDSTRIPWEDPETGKGGLQRIVNVSSIPRGPGSLDDAVRIIVDLPPGSGKGPVVSPNLGLYGVQSAPHCTGAC